MSKEKDIYSVAKSWQRKLIKKLAAKHEVRTENRLRKLEKAIAYKDEATLCETIGLLIIEEDEKKHGKKKDINNN